MYPECRHIMPNGKKCAAPALRGTPFCYFHTNLHRIARRKSNPEDSIEIPALEDRCAIQLTITQILRALVKAEIDPRRGSLLLYGLQIASQNVDRRSSALSFESVRAVTHASNGDELARQVDDEGEEDEEEDDDEDDAGETEDDDTENDDEDVASDETDQEGVDKAGPEDDDEDDEFPGESTEDLVAGLKYLDSIKRQAHLDP